ncbi:MAG: hypothetical protein IPK68_20550 [Bdellovibrionales bacterium]|nr:hypothetical protein [Bdellovibrionales bacterium]
MKILKLKRGFTTNSSGTNEWVSTQNSNSNNLPVNYTWNNLGKLGMLVVLVSILIFVDQLVRNILSFKKTESSNEGEQ